MNMLKEGYYLAILAGGGGETVLYCDGEQLYAHGSPEVVPCDILEYISESPLDLSSLPDLIYVSPH